MAGKQKLCHANATIAVSWRSGYVQLHATLVSGWRLPNYSAAIGMTNVLVSVGTLRLRGKESNGRTPRKNKSNDRTVHTENLLLCSVLSTRCNTEGKTVSLRWYGVLTHNRAESSINQSINQLVDRPMHPQSFWIAPRYHVLSSGWEQPSTPRQGANE